MATRSAWTAGTTRIAARLFRATKTAGITTCVISSSDVLRCVGRTRRCGVVTWVLCSEQDVYAFARQLDGETVVVALNISRDTRNVSLPVNNVREENAVLQNAWGQDRRTVTQGTLRDLKLAPRSGLVLTQGDQ